MDLNKIFKPPTADKLVFTQHASYARGVDCIYDDDLFTELLNEELDSFVLNPWSWVLDAENIAARLTIISIAIATLIMNILVIVTFIKEQMLTALNIILIGISVSDTITVCIPALTLTLLLLDGRMPDYIPFEYCSVYAYLTKYLPTISHNASVWLTVVLAYDRYIAVEKPFLLKQVCLPKRSISVVITIYLTAVLGHLCRFFDTDYAPVKIVSSTNAQSYFQLMNTSYTSFPEEEISEAIGNTTQYNITGALREICDMSKGIETCKAVYKPAFRDLKYYEFCYYWFVILFVKFIPCTLLIVIDTLMLKSLRKSEKLRYHMANHTTAVLHSLSSRRAKYQESKRMTIILVIAIIIVVIVELPIAVILMLWTLANIHGQQFMTEIALNNLSRIANTAVYISYPVIFMLYCCLSARFRAAFFSLGCFRRCRNSVLLKSSA
ncbi:sex peptide receptor-like [Mya arenaria]|uniref:sex peptide receptor-like n=1 Tax=Mya arenaria TaxID=6604 RepID=UPI0022E77310|nr:sex peptide receptor-like [Mya arenaria]